MIIAAYQTPSGRRPVEDFIEGLSKADQAKFAEIHRGIEGHGLEYHGVEFRQLEGKLWELKFRAPGGGYRIAYVCLLKEKMIWLHAFKKSSQKTRNEDFALALRRMKEVLP
jgi:phage-related protein